MTGDKQRRRKNESGVDVQVSHARNSARSNPNPMPVVPDPNTCLEVNVHKRDD
jgi:hypothetical protein